MSKRNVKSLICLTEESVETLYLLGKENLIKGVSCFIERPEQAKQLPIVTSFIKADVEKIKSIDPDLVIGFSDIQKDIAKQLIAQGQEVYISNQRSIKEILDYIYRLSLMVDAKEDGLKLITKLEKLIEQAQFKAKKFKYKPRIYFEEWDEPMINAIQWVSDIFEICGAENIFHEKSQHSLAKDRYVKSSEVIERNPELIFICWCGKKADLESVKNRPGWDQIDAVKNNQIFELDPAIFLQPGPAPIISGLNVILEKIQSSNIDKK